MAQEQLLALASGVSPIQLSVLLAAVALVSLFVGRVLVNKIPGKSPPILEGVPFIGGLLKFAGVSHGTEARARNDHASYLHLTPTAMQGPWRLMEQGYSTLGEAFTVPVAHKRVTFLIGPDVAPHFFKATDDELSQTEVR